MKTVLSLSLGLLASMLTIATPVHADPSYTLVCRGGPVSRVLYRGSSDQIEMTFKRATRSGSLGIEAGSCAWLDRVILPGEPNTVCQAGVAAKTVAWNNQATTMVIKAVNAPYFDFIYSDAHRFVFQAYNNGKGCLQVTHVGL